MHSTQCLVSMRPLLILFVIYIFNITLMSAQVVTSSTLTNETTTDSKSTEQSTAASASNNGSQTTDLGLGGQNITTPQGAIATLSNNQTLVSNATAANQTLNATHQAVVPANQTLGPTTTTKAIPTLIPSNQTLVPSNQTVCPTAIVANVTLGPVANITNQTTTKKMITYQCYKCDTSIYGCKDPFCQRKKVVRVFCPPGDSCTKLLYVHTGKVFRGCSSDSPVKFKTKNLSCQTKKSNDYVVACRCNERLCNGKTRVAPVAEVEYLILLSFLFCGHSLR